MSPHRGSRRSRWWWAAGLSFLLAAGAALVFATGLSGEGLDRANKLAGLGSLLTEVVALLVGAIALQVALRQDKATPVQDPSDATAALDRAVSGLAEAVRRQWRYEADLRRLRQPWPLRVRWSSTTRPVSAPPTAILGDGVVAGRPTRLKLQGDLYGVVDIFQKLPSRQLVVLGEPGAGKTALAMLFTLDLLDSRAPGDPLPVLLPIASWNPDIEHLHAWLTRRLLEDYPALANSDTYGPDAATRLVHEDRLVPVLDGLDEMPPALQGEAIKALDRAVASGSPLLVTCRAEEYAAAVSAGGSFLSRAAVVEIQPVDSSSTIDFLSATVMSEDSRWEPVFEQLRNQPGGPLATALSTPLMVDLARTAYMDPASDPAELCDRGQFVSREAIEEHLLGAYVPSLCDQRREPPPASDGAPSNLPHRYTAAQARRWLTFLAVHLHRQQTRDLAWWQLHAALPNRTKRWLGGLALGVADGVICGTAVGIPVGIGGFAAGFVGAFAPGLLGAVLSGPPRQPRQVRKMAGRRRHHGQRLVVEILAGLGIGIAGGVAAGLTIALTIGMMIGAVVGVTVLIAVALLVGLTQLLNTPVDVIHAPSPASVLQNDRTVSCLRAVCGVFGIGLVVGFVAENLGVRSLNIGAGFVIGLTGGLVAMLVSRLLTGFAGRDPTERIAGGLSDGAWGWFLLSHGWLALTGRLPWRLMTFLGDAHLHGVLRQSGAAYQFRHARLQDHLAGAHRGR